MKVLDVVKLTAFYIGQKDLLSTTSLGGNTAPTENQTQTLDEIKACVNDVVETIALLYFPLRYEENITTENGVVNFSSFSKAVCEILEVRDKLGFSVDFSTFPTYLKTSAGELRFSYHYLPEKVENVSDDLEGFEEKVSLRLVASGVLSRYYPMQGMFADAESWQRAFERTALALQNRKKNKMIRKRRWL